MRELEGEAVAIDIETTGLTWKDRMLVISLAKRGQGRRVKTLVLNTGYEQRANLFGIAFGDSADVRDREIRPLSIPEAREEFQNFIKGASVLIFHNGSFDIPYIVRSTIMTREELDQYIIFDTMVWARCTGSHESVSLENLLIDFKIKTDLEWGKTKDLRKNIENLPYDQVKSYAALDADYTLRLSEKIIPKVLEIYEDDLVTEESDWVKLISLMRVDGIQIDLETARQTLSEKKKKFTTMLMDLRSYKIEGPNHRTSILRWVGTIDQTAYLRLTDKGNPSLDDDSLKRLKGGEAAAVVDLILTARHLQKEISTWIEASLDHACSAGRIHPHFIVSGARSNRLTCKEPSAHTIPKELEEVLFTALPGYHLCSWDYEQAELRAGASYSNEQVLVDEFHRGGDPHMATAKRIFGPEADKSARRRAKNCTYSRLYGGGARAYMDQANKGLPRPQWVKKEEAWELLNQHKRALPAIDRTAKQAEQIWISRGYLTVLGGKRVYASKSDLERSYKAFNYLIQPSVAELVKKAMVKIWRTFPDVIMVNQKHDSIYAEIPFDNNFESKCRKIEEIMVEVYPEELRNRTSPPVNMAVDMERDKPGLPYPGENS